MINDTSNLVAQISNGPKKRVKLLVAPIEVSGYYSALARGLSEAGLSTDFVTFVPHPFAYRTEEKRTWLFRFIRRVFSFVRKEGPFALRLLSALPWLISVHLWSIFAIFKYNTFIFAFGQTLFPGTQLDLPILKLLGKRVIINVGHGSEARPPYLDGTYLLQSGARSPEFYEQTTRKMRRKVQFLEKYSSVLIGSPFSSHFFARKPFVNWFELGIPAQMESCPKTGAPEVEAVLDSQRIEKTKHSEFRILHAPSAAIAKGTDAIRAAVAALQDDGWNVKLDEVHGVPNEEVLRKLARCDFVVDQMYSDTPLSGFATEAAVMGKPSVIGSYAGDPFKKTIPIRALPPSLVVHPDELKAGIQFFLQNPDKMKEFGRQAQAFVSKNWQTTAVAERFVALILDQAPTEWFVDPKSLVYVKGACQSEHVSAQILADLVGKFGVDGLHLQDRPDLVAALRLNGLLKGGEE